jgi:hypothetical protein
VFVCLVFCPFSSALAYSGGSGTEVDPYQISTVSDWNDLMYTPADGNKCFILTTDINLQGVSLMPVGSEEIPFTGIFDGNSHIIRNVSIINSPISSFVGLFGYVNYDGQIRNLGVENVNITGTSYVGGLVGYNGGVIISCYATGMVTQYLTGNYSGGLVGYNNGTISDCYAMCVVTGSYFAGGLAGYNDTGGIITACYATGAVSEGDNNGGLAGHDHGNISISACFWDVNTSGLTTSDGGVGKTTTEMKTLSTFISAGWDFVGESANGTADIWKICDGTNYPKLAWQKPLPGNFLCPDEVGLEDLAYFVQRWLMTDCNLYDDCNGTDINIDGKVDFVDFALLANNWQISIGKSGTNLKITIDHTKVAEDLIDFPVLITEAGLPAKFWLHVDPNGKDISCLLADGTKLKQELVSIDKENEKLELWVKLPLVSSSVDTVFYISYGNSELSEPNNVDVWDGNFKLVQHLSGNPQGAAPQFMDSTSQHNDVTAGGMFPQWTKISDNGFNINAHQGVAYDGTYYYIIHTNWIKKYDKSWNLIATNTNVFDQARALLPEENGYFYNHLGDGAVYDGVLYVPLEYWNGQYSYSKNERIVKVQTSDLTVIDCVDVSAQGHEVSGFYVDANYVYATAFVINNSNKIYRYNRSDLSYANNDITLSASQPYTQGITSDGTYFYITTGGQYIKQVGSDGTVLGNVYAFESSIAEGICFLPDQNEFAVLYDPGGNQKIYFLGIVAGGSTNIAGKFGESAVTFNGINDSLTRTSPSGLNSLSNFTFEAWAYYLSDYSDNRILERNNQFAFKVYYENGKHQLDVWRDGWKKQDIKQSPLYAWHYFVASWNGSAVTFYCDGEQLGDPINLTGTTGTTGDLYLGCYNSTTSLFKGYMDEVRISNNSRSSGWIATCYNNQNSPSTFYSVQPIIPPPPD